MFCFYCYLVGVKGLTIVTKSFIADVSLGSKYASDIYINSQQEVFGKKAVLINSQNSQENTCTVTKKRLRHICFTLNFSKVVILLTAESNYLK